VRAAVSLGLLGFVAAGIASVDALAAQSGADPGALRRLCAYLAAKGVFEAPSPGMLALTSIGRLLAGPRADLFMLLFGGAGRSLDRFSALAGHAGLEVAGTHEIDHYLSFIELHPPRRDDHA
jgi:hypothetical protein